MQTLTNNNGKSPILLGISGIRMDKKQEMRLRRINPTGIILFSRNFQSRTQLVELISDIKSILGVKTMIAVDHEGGRVVRFPKILPILPAASVLGKLNNPQMVYKLTREAGLGLRSLGISLNLAPVTDVATNLSHPSLIDRCFGHDPFLVTEMALAFIEGMRKAGIQCTAKHFPGLGYAANDTHFSGTAISCSCREMEQHWGPFRAAIDAGVEAILISHAVYKKIDKVNPATFSKVVIKKYLRKNLKFSGLVISDDLEMEAIAGKYSLSEAIDRCLAAGCDIASVCHDNNNIL